MISNLASARALLQADLDHARNVMDLWAHQVSELQKALDQIDAVSTSRDGLRAQYQGSKAASAVLVAPIDMNKPPRRGRKARQATQDGSGRRSADASAALKKGRKPEAGNAERTRAAKTPRPPNAQKGGNRSKADAQAKFRDPESGKTWAGKGRRPLWLRGDPQQYAIRPGSPETTRAPRTEGNPADTHQPEQAGS